MAEVRREEWVELRGGYKLRPVYATGGGGRVRIEPAIDRDYVNGYEVDIAELREGLKLIEGMVNG